jgi:hypothetical protein
MTDDLSMNKQATDERAIFQSLEALFEEIDRKLLLTQRLDLQIKALYSSSRDRNEILFPPRLVTHEHFESFRMKVESKLDKLATDVTQTSSNLAEQKRMLSAVLENQKRLFEILQDIKPTQNQLLTVQPVHAHHQAQHESPVRNVRGTNQTPAAAQTPAQPNEQTKEGENAHEALKKADATQENSEQPSRGSTYQAPQQRKIQTPMLNEIVQSTEYINAEPKQKEAIDFFIANFERGHESAPASQEALCHFVLVLLTKIPLILARINTKGKSFEAEYLFSFGGTANKNLMNFLTGVHRDEQFVDRLKKWGIPEYILTEQALLNAIEQVPESGKHNSHKYGMWLTDNPKPLSFIEFCKKVKTEAGKVAK